MDQRVENYLNEEAEKNPEFKAKLDLLDKDKIWISLLNWAKTKAINGCACISDDDVYRQAKDIVNDWKEPVEINEETEDDREESKRISAIRIAKRKEEIEKTEKEKLAKELLKKQKVDENQISLFGDDDVA